MLRISQKLDLDAAASASIMHYAAAVAVVLVSVVLASPVHQLMPHASLSLLFLTGVLIVSARTGLGPSLFSSVLSFLAFNFFFTQPYYTLEVADDGDVATLVFFLFMAAITGNLAARMHKEMDKSQASLQRISNLYEFNRRISSATDAGDVIEALADHLAHSIGSSVVVLMGRSVEPLEVSARTGEEMLPQPDCIEAAWSRSGIEPVVEGGWHFLKLTTNQESIGMVAVCGHLDSGQITLAQTLCDQAAIVLDRTNLVVDLEQARLVSETERLRSALLSSVSHDLRTPLASIIGSSSSLLEYGEVFSSEDKQELMATVLDEAMRLDRHIQNLLDMTRLGQGSLNLKRDWVDVHDVVSSAVNRLRDTLKELMIRVDIAEDVPLLWVHGILIEQALVNLLDNAVCYSPSDGEIALSVRVKGELVEIEVCDSGPGIPLEEREKIFDMFYTVSRGDRGNTKGTGLGLAICRGMVAAHGGSVVALEGRSGKGTCMLVELPIRQPEGEG